VRAALGALALAAAAAAAAAAVTPSAAVQEAPAVLAPRAAVHLVAPPEGEVYAAYLDQAFAPISDDGPVTRETLLVENDALDAWTPNRRAWEAWILQHNSGQGRADPGLLDAFIRRPQQAIRFYQFPAAQTPVRLVRSDVLAPLLAKGWNGFYDAYPKVQGVLSFSAVAFKADGSEALFAAQQRCGKHCGYRDLILMRKVNGAWTMVMQDPLP
jgi:hypothetical protein